MYMNIKGNNLASEIKNGKKFTEDFSSGIQKIKKITEDMNQIWKEEDYRNFSQQMLEFANQLEKLQDQMERFFLFVEGYSNTNKLLDDNYQKKKITLK